MRSSSASSSFSAFSASAALVRAILAGSVLLFRWRGAPVRGEFGAVAGPVVLAELNEGRQTGPRSSGRRPPAATAAPESWSAAAGLLRLRGRSSKTGLRISAISRRSKVGNRIAARVIHAARSKLERAEHGRRPDPLARDDHHRKARRSVAEDQLLTERGRPLLDKLVVERRARPWRLRCCRRGCGCRSPPGVGAYPLQHVAHHGLTRLVEHVVVDFQPPANRRAQGSRPAAARCFGSA